MNEHATLTEPPRPRLPLELLLLICDECETQSTLAALCRIWRGFKAPVERRLYRNVDLVGRSMATILSWCRTLRRHPRLPKLVHSLRIQLPHAIKISPEDASKIAPALVSCVNLKVLRFLREEADRQSGTDWVLEMCSFRLTEFACSYLDSFRIKKVLAKQPELRFLRVVGGPRLELLSLEAEPWGPRPELPNLVGIKGPASFFGHPHNRPLQRIEIALSYSCWIPPLEKYAGTLTTLNILLPASNAVSTGETLDSISKILPCLVHLAIVEEQLWLFPHKRQWESLPCLEAFTRLKTLSLIYRDDSMGFNSDKRQAFSGGSARDGGVVREVLGCCLEACLSLRRMTIGTEAERGVERMYTSRRSSGGTEIETTTYGYIDFEAISMFWV
ncbi:hypothetical protein HMN09_01310900 [Mycena chlorophos]|uniref:F-box domain-containing protein n=1 Tax=Mycena chlorophos TaxID=658473 RepID=A0A8H6VU02_MYCCL|nr:hypothetical protein HMN09_01310900 [Mycena chlorophos]